MGTPFMVDQETIDRLTTLRKVAETNPVSEEEIRAAVARLDSGQFTPPQINFDQTVELPFGYTLTFTVEWQPAGMARHASMASPNPRRVPIFEAMSMVIPHLGFKGTSTYEWLEPLSNGGAAFNILEFIS